MDKTDSELALAESLREQLYRQLVGHHVSAMPSTIPHDRFVADDLMKEVSRLCGMYRANESRDVIVKQLEDIRGRLLIAASTEMLGTKDNEKAQEILDQLTERAKA